MSERTDCFRNGLDFLGERDLLVGSEDEAQASAATLLLKALELCSDVVADPLNALDFVWSFEFGDVNPLTEESLRDEEKDSRRDDHDDRKA